MNQVTEDSVINWIVYYRANNKQYESGQFDTIRYAAYTKEQAISIFEQAHSKAQYSVLAVAKDFNASITKKSIKTSGAKYDRDDV
jgi:hypothetical protein